MRGVWVKQNYSDWEMTRAEFGHGAYEDTDMLLLYSLFICKGKYSDSEGKTMATCQSCHVVCLVWVSERPHRQLRLWTKTRLCVWTFYNRKTFFFAFLTFCLCCDQKIYWNLKSNFGDYAFLKLFLDSAVKTILSRYKHVEHQHQLTIIICITPNVSLNLFCS